MSLWIHKTKAGLLIQFLNSMVEFERSSIRLGNVMHTLYAFELNNFIYTDTSYVLVTEYSVLLTMFNLLLLLFPRVVIKVENNT
jgi:hypothetical protein